MPVTGHQYLQTTEGGLAPNNGPVYVMFLYVLYIYICHMSYTLYIYYVFYACVCGCVLKNAFRFIVSAFSFFSGEAHESAG